MIKGLIVGGFRPFHAGHEALIEYAKNNCDDLTILVGALLNEPIEYKYRLKWVLSTYLDDPTVNVVGDLIVEPKFENSDEKSKWWAKYVIERYGKFDRVFSSEAYGKVFSESLGAENWVFNQDRTIIPISATMIRNKPLTYWNYINNFAKDYFVKKIAIIGTESTGKTTMAQQLAEHYNTQWCAEVGRDLIPDTKECTIEDLKLVGVEHAKSIIKHTRLSNKLLFVDTDLNITKSYSKYLFNEIPDYPEWVEKANQMDLYIWLTSETPYINDGTRLPINERKLLEIEHIKQIKENIDSDKFIKVPYYISAENPYEYRLNNVINIIDEFIKKY